MESLRLKRPVAFLLLGPGFRDLGLRLLGFEVLFPRSCIAFVFCVSARSLCPLGIPLRFEVVCLALRLSPTL